jgi:Arc/MetJ family transcription regulator
MTSLDGERRSQTTVARTTIYLDDTLRAHLERVVPARGKNRFINEAVREKLAVVEGRALEQALKEGYLATRSDRASLNDDWQAVDLPAWPE